MKVDISFIIPVYNGESNISISLDSLINQTYSNFEVIIVDDGSKDNTFKVINKYKNNDSRFKYIYQENSGVAKTRNKGLEVAKGEYICFLDSDDYYEENFIEKMHSRIITTKSDVCYCAYNVVTPNKVFKKKSEFKRGNILIDYILGKVSVHTTGWMIKRKLIEQYNIAFPEGVSWGEDFEFFCEVLARTKEVVFVKEYLTNYRLAFDGNQLSTFSIDKLDKDYDSIKRVQSNSIINYSKLIDSALIDYRLSALLTYRLIEAVRLNENRESIISYSNKYEDYITKLTWNNGLRSLKLNLSRLKLKYTINRI